MNQSNSRSFADDPVLDRLIAHYLERVDAGESVDREQFISEHIVYAGMLRRYFENVAVVDRLTGGDDASGSGDVSGQATGSEAYEMQQTVVRGAADSRTSVEPANKGERTDSGIPQQFGRYRILRTLGQGAMGAVYLAHDSHLDRQVALKVPTFTDNSGGELLQRFYREARAAAMLRHSNICPVFDVGEINGQHYITMAFIEGRPLRDFSRSGKQHSERQTAVIIRKLATALAEAHKHGIIHRDLKPANIMIDEKGEPVVMDFGLARRSGSDEIHVTQDGAILGTPAYMSPEQTAGDQTKVGPQADVYGLGVITYELITGRLPFQGSLMAVLKQIAADEPPPPSELREGLDPELEAICLKMMARDLTVRYQSMEAVAEDLVKFLKRAALRTASPAPAGDPPAGAADSGPTSSNPELFSGMGEFARATHDQTAPVVTRVAGSRRRNVSRPLIATAGLFAAALIFGAVTFFLRVGDVDVKVVIDDPTLAVRFDRQTVTFDGSGSPIRLKPGGQRFVIERDGLEVRTDEFTVSKDGRNILHVSIVDGQVAWDRKEAGQPTAPGNVAVAESRKSDEDPSPVSTPNAEPKSVAEAAFQKWLDEVAVLSTKDQVEAVRRKLIELNPGFDGNFRALVETDYVTEVSIRSEVVQNISPFRAWVSMPLSRLDCSYTKVADLSPLTGMKLNWLACSHTKILNLEPLRGMPLKELYCRETLVSDLSSLEGMQLVDLDIGGTKVSDLTPLKGMPLRRLYAFGANQIIDLSPLEGMPLTELQFGYAGEIHDLSPLRGMPLEILTIFITKVTDLSPLEGMPLKTLFANYAYGVSDLSPLRDAKLENLSIGNTKITDLSPLAGLPITNLEIWNSQISDLTPLRGKQLTRLLMDNSQVSDLTPLTGMPIKALSMDDLVLTDLSPLDGMPLVELRITRTKVPDRSVFRQFPLVSVFLDFLPERDTEWLRAIATLKSINGRPVAEFWAEIDQQPATVR